MPEEPRPFLNSADHILSELGYLDLLLRRAVVIARARRPAIERDAFRGLLTSDAEVDHLIDTIALRGESHRTRALLAELDEKIAGRREEIGARLSVSLREGVRLSLAQLVQLFALSEAETDLL